MTFPGMEMFSKNMYSDNYQVFEAVYGRKKKCDDKEESKPVVRDSIFLSMRGYLIFGRFLGIIPVSGVFSPTHESLRFK